MCGNSDIIRETYLPNAVYTGQVIITKTPLGHKHKLFPVGIILQKNKVVPQKLDQKEIDILLQIQRMRLKKINTDVICIFSGTIDEIILKCTDLDIEAGFKLSLAA